MLVIREVGADDEMYGDAEWLVGNAMHVGGDPLYLNDHEIADAIRSWLESGLSVRFVTSAEVESE